MERIGITPDALRLDGQVALVTGASRNLGAAIAASFAAAGADVLMVARGAEQLEEVAHAIRRQSPDRRVETVVADIAVREEVERLCAQAFDRFGRVDTLVNNAATFGMDEPQNVLDVGDELWGTVLEANLLAPLRLSRTLAGAMLAGRGGSIINVVSGAGLLPNSAPGHLPAPTVAPYGVSKAALWMLTRYMAAELAPHVRVNALCPGLVAPRDRTHDAEPHVRLIRQGAVPMGRIGAPEEIAGAAVYLASPAASYTTGEILICNGGRAW